MTILTGIIGHPVSHSISPIIHEYWMREYGIDGKYTPIDVIPKNLKSTIKELKSKGFVGLNVTVPHKIKVMEFCDELSAAAKAIGAVNTLSIREGKIYGDNTDCFGFMKSIEQQFPEFDTKAGAAVILGNGGAARAIAYGLHQARTPEIRVIGKSAERANTISDIAPIKPFTWQMVDQALKGANILINASPLGMSGNPPLSIDLSCLPKEALVCDIVYAPLITDLLQSAKNHGNNTLTGIGMLLHQARGGFKSWHGIEPNVTKALEAKALAR